MIKFDFKIYKEQIEWSYKIRKQKKQEPLQTFLNQDVLPPVVSPIAAVLHDGDKHKEPKPLQEINNISGASKRIKKGRGRPLKDIKNCRHVDRPHYARGMCKSCYGTFGNSNKATLCEHVDSVVYGRGLCVICYRRWYNKEVRHKNRAKQKAAATSTSTNRRCKFMSDDKSRMSIVSGPSSTTQS